jgi:DNA topoisomerase-2
MESVQKLTHIEHILKRPDSYVGPVEHWVLNPTGFSMVEKFDKEEL